MRPLLFEEYVSTVLVDTYVSSTDWRTYIYLSFPISLSCSLLLYPIYLRALVVQLLCVLYCLKNMCPLLGQSSTCGHKNMCPLLGQSCTGGHICVLYRLKDTYIYLSCPISLSCSLLRYPIYLRALVVQLYCYASSTIWRICVLYLDKAQLVDIRFVLVDSFLFSQSTWWHHTSPRDVYVFVCIMWVVHMCVRLQNTGHLMPQCGLEIIDRHHHHHIA
jgi:hypothetical protein